MCSLDKVLMQGGAVFNKPVYTEKVFTRANSQIRAERVRLIDSDGRQVGIVPLSEALSLAREQGLDLIEIAPTASPPVAKIFPLDKFKYEQQRKSRESKKKQKDVEIKEIRVRPNIAQGDLDQRIARIEEFLDKDCRVKLVVQFQGRELAHREFGSILLNRIVKSLNRKVVFEKEPKFEGRSFITIISQEKG